MIFRHRLICLLCASLLACPIASAAGEDQRFAAQDEGQYSFDTGLIRGKLSLNGRPNGIVSLVHAGTGEQLAHGAGVMNLYRLFSSSRRYGDAARNWQVTSKLLDGGAVEATYPAAGDRPFVIRTVYRLPAADTVDLEIAVTAEADLPQFELFQSSYFNQRMTGMVYVKPPFFMQGSPRFLSPDYHDLLAGTYLMFPRDEAAIRLIHDGRWRRPPHPVQWSISQWMAAPLAVRTDAETGVTVAMMAPPEDCFALAAPYNRVPQDGIAAHGSLYFSLFGSDLPKSETVRSRVRLVVFDQLETDLVVQQYRQFVGHED